MNRTPRLLNRLILALGGVILLAIGAGMIALASVPEARSLWSGPAADTLDGVAEFWAGAPESTPGHSVWWLAVIAAAVVLVALALVVVTRQGRGRTGQLLRRTGDGLDGGVEFDVAVAEEALEAALKPRPEIVSVHVTGYRVGDATQLRIDVAPRPGSAPDAIADLVEARLRDWDAALGAELPALISLNTGVRARSAGIQRAN